MCDLARYWVDIAMGAGRIVCFWVPHKHHNNEHGGTHNVGDFITAVVPIAAYRFLPT